MIEVTELKPPCKGKYSAKVIGVKNIMLTNKQIKPH